MKSNGSFFIYDLAFNCMLWMSFCVKQNGTNNKFDGDKKAHQSAKWLSESSEKLMARLIDLCIFCQGLCIIFCHRVCR